MDLSISGGFSLRNLRQGWEGWAAGFPALGLGGSDTEQAASGASLTINSARPGSQSPGWWQRQLAARPLPCRPQGSMIASWLAPGPEAHLADVCFSGLLGPEAGLGAGGWVLRAPRWPEPLPVTCGSRSSPAAEGRALWDRLRAFTPAWGPHPHDLAIPGSPSSLPLMAHWGQGHSRAQLTCTLDVPVQLQRGTRGATTVAELNGKQRGHRQGRWPQEGDRRAEDRTTLGGTCCGEGRETRGVQGRQM